MEALRKAFDEISLSYSTRTSYLHRDLFRDQLVRAAELLGAVAPADLLERFESDNLANLISHMRPREDAAEMLRALEDRHVYRAVVSNADDDFLGPLLQRNGLDGLLDDWTSSEEAASCKPDPRIFQHALKKAGFAAEEVLFVGDSVQHDIVGASRVGMRSVLIDNGLDAAPLSHGLDASAEPDFSIQDLTELLPIVDKFNARS
jgi:HAD superfamily hydrolase (TIGR01509 family)